MNTSNAFEILYDTYSPVLYGIALRLSPSESDAEAVLIAAFQEIYLQDLSHDNHSSLSLKFVRMIIRICYERFNPGRVKDYFNLQEFDSMPFFTHLLCEETGVDGYCLKYNIERKTALEKLHVEYRHLLNRRRDVSLQG